MQTEQEQLNAMYERVLQVFPESLWNTLAPQQQNIVDNAINRVATQEGLDAVTVPRLDGILELATQHLWSPALTAASKSLPASPTAKSATSDLTPQKSMGYVREPATGTTLPPDLVAAYLATQYQVNPSDGQPGFTLRIGTKQSDLLSLMNRSNVTSSAYITACNPLGKNLSDVENRSRQAALQKVLEQCSLAHLPGIGQGTVGDWPGEESFLILGLNLAAAKRLATDFEQNAFVWVGADTVPQLVLLQ